MPVFVDPKACVNRENCFAAGACPYDAFLHNNLKQTWEVDANVCGDCPGPCLNFCDKDALHWGDDLEDLRLVRAQVEGTMKPDAVKEARMQHRKDVAEQAIKAAAAKRAAEEAASAHSEGVIALTARNFEREVLRSPVPVVIDCWAEWCGPCKQFSPIFEATAKQYVGIVKFAKLDSDGEPALASGLGVQALPTVLMFYKGQLVNVAEGALPAASFQQWIYQTLAAIRQHEAQLTAEAPAAIEAAAKAIASLNAHGPAGTEDEAQSDDLIVGPNATSAPPPAPTRPERGKQTSSGLFIP